jgi:hypothetical protein
MLGPAILAFVLFDGYSRIFYDNHYLTHVISGYDLDIGWLVLLLPVIEMI